MVNASVIPQRTLDLFTLGGRFGFPGSFQAPYSGEAKELGSLIDIKAGVPLTDKTTIPINVNHFYFNDGIIAELRLVYNIIRPE